MQAQNTEYVGNDIPKTNGVNPKVSVDLAPVEFGTNTFRHPLFWVGLGVALTIGVQIYLDHRKRKN